MKLKLPKVNILWNWNFVIAFFLLLFLLSQAHQLLHHTIGGILCGHVGYLTFDRHSFSKELSPFGVVVATIPGPLVNYVAMWIGLFLLRSGRYTLFGFSLIFASMPFGRFAASQFGGDERQFGQWIGQLFGLGEKYTPIISMLIVLLIIVPPLITAYKSIGNRRKLNIFLAFLFLPVVLYFIFCFFPDHAFLVPVVRETIKTGISPTPLVSLFWGLPLILIIAIVVSTILFLGKYVRYLLPHKEEVKNKI